MGSPRIKCLQELITALDDASLLVTGTGSVMSECLAHQRIAKGFDGLDLLETAFWVSWFQKASRMLLCL